MSKSHVTLIGSVPLNKHARLGMVDPRERIEVCLKLKRQTEDGLPTLHEFIKGARSKGITRKELTQKYAASSEAAETVRHWAADQGLEVESIDLGARDARLAGSAAALSKAFGTKLSLYRHKRTGTTFRCPENDLQIPQDLAKYVTGVFGMNDMPVVMRHRVRVGRKAPAADLKSQWPGSFFPNEVAQLYQFPPSQGAGQRVAILEFGGGIDQSVLTAYFTQTIGLPVSPTVNPISVLKAPIKVDDDVTGEVYLDIEVIGAMAPKATMDVFFAPWTGEGYLAAIEAAIRNEDYAALSISYGIDEDLHGTAGNPGWPALNQHVDEAFRDATALGLPLFVSSGDQGSSGLRGQVGGNEVTALGQNASASYPASSPYATAVGGTMLYSADGQQIDREIVWNELGPLQQSSFFVGGATGGGVSDRYPTPSYQTKAGITPKSVNTPGGAGRGVPDIAGNAGASTGYLVSQPPGSQVGPIAPVGGTSAAAPMWAALMACVRASLTTTLNGSIPVFFFNDFVYACGNTAAFRDIVEGREFGISPQGQLTPGAFIPIGNNKSSKADGYYASQGYDLCTGWGSPNGVALLAQLNTWLAAQQPHAAREVVHAE
jgi:kumamolisin